MSSTQYIDIDRSLQNLETVVDPTNAAAIREFIDHCAAEGIGASQQERLIYSWKTLLTKFAPADFRVVDASEATLKELVANLNRSDYAEATKHKCRCAIKKFYKLQNGGEHPDKVKFFSVHQNRKPTSVTREDLFTPEELTRLLNGFTSTRDRALTYVLYESGARPGEILSRSLGDFTTTEKGDFISIEGLKGTPDRTNQLVRSGRVVREWLAQHPFGGEVGAIEDPSAPLWVKTEQQACLHCGELPRNHADACTYEPDLRDRVTHAGYYRRFKAACERAAIPATKARPYTLRHTRLTEVATFMAYEPLNKFAGWVPGSDRAQVYVHLNNEDVNRAIRKEYGLDTEDDASKPVVCAFCVASNQATQTECRTCGRPLSLEAATTQTERYRVLERLADLEAQGVLEHLERLARFADDSD